MTLFDKYIFVDWSSASSPSPTRPSRDAIWSGILEATDRNPSVRYYRTRAELVIWLQDELIRQVDNQSRALVGFDFPYGYPAGFASALGLSNEDQPWLQTWRLLSETTKDSSNNRNNRFAVASQLNARIGGPVDGPFWGCPESQVQAGLQTKGVTFPFLAAKGWLGNKRVAEGFLRGTQPTWKLAYPGSVGSQALVGIPRVHQLRFHPQLSPVSRVWPFETGFSADDFPGKGPFVLHAEIWPGVIENRVQQVTERRPSRIRDEVQVEELCLWARELDEAGRLAALFDTPDGLTPTQVHQCEAEEGWILGAGHQTFDSRSPVTPPSATKAGTLSSNAGPGEESTQSRVCPACGEHQFKKWPLGWDSHAAHKCRGLEQNDPADRKREFRSRFAKSFDE